MSKERQRKYSWAPEWVAIPGNTSSREIVHHWTLTLGSYIEERCIQDLPTCTDDTGSTCGWTNALSKAGCRLHHHCREKEHRRWASDSPFPALPTETLYVGSPPWLFVRMSIVQSPSICRLSLMTEHFLEPRVNPEVKKVSRSFPVNTSISSGWRSKPQIKY